jgi:hypothetical protein
VQAQVVQARVAQVVQAAQADSQGKGQAHSR